jgi:hypothetical protein
MELNVAVRMVLVNLFGKSYKDRSKTPHNCYTDGSEAIMNAYLKVITESR